MTLRLILTLLLVLPIPALADVESRYVDSPGFASVDDAAVAALTIAMERSEESGFEFGGILFEYDGLFYYTEPVTSGHRHRVEYQGMLPNNAELSGTYHSHPTKGRVRFSDSDIRGAKDRRVASYLGIVSTGSIKCYDPGVTGQSKTTAIAAL